ncbi:transposase [Streptomyces sp. NPDC101234]|uniref:transposase n=1 Tax=Streptomyces sp. NPDC101234 TaxID=3366138 RepID=UPI0038235B68
MEIYRFSIGWARGETEGGQFQVGSESRKPYSEKHKREAIELVRSPGRTVTEAARELGIASESVRGWSKKARAAQEAEAGAGLSGPGGGTTARAAPAPDPIGRNFTATGPGEVVMAAAPGRLDPGCPFLSAWPGWALDSP